MKKYFPAILLLALSGFSTRAFTQPTLTTAQLKPFVGYYRSTVVKDLLVQIRLERDTLIARALWVNMTVHLIPKKELVFRSIEPIEAGPADFTFLRDSTGGIGALSLNGAQWNRDINYQSAAKKEIERTPGQLMPFAGVYHLQQDPYRLLDISIDNKHLVLKQMWNDQQIRFLSDSTLDFFSKDAPLFTLHFTKDNTGKVTQMLAFKSDTWIKEKKLDLSPATLGLAAGKYQSKDDPDNQITISVRDATLVVKQGWDGQEIALKALTDSYFYNKAKAYYIILYKETNGAINQLNLLGTNNFVRIPQ